jgi:hypothetical protein
MIAFDPGEPDPARIHDILLGGTGNYAPDREQVNASCVKLEQFSDALERFREAESICRVHGLDETLVDNLFSQITPLLRCGVISSAEARQRMERYAAQEYRIGFRRPASLRKRRYHTASHLMTARRGIGRRRHS